MRRRGGPGWAETRQIGRAPLGVLAGPTDRGSRVLEVEQFESPARLHEDSVRRRHKQLRGSAPIDVGGTLEKTLGKIAAHIAGCGVEHRHVPLAVSRVIEQIYNDFRSTIPRHIDDGVRSDLRPFRPFVDVLFDVASPFDGKSFCFRPTRIELEDIDMTLKVAQRHQLGLAVGIDVGQTKPAVGAARMVTQLGFLAARCPFEDHHAIVSGHADLERPIAVDVGHHVQGVEDETLRRIGLPYATRSVKTLVVSEQLQAADLLVGPGVIPRDPLQSGNVGKDFRPVLVERLRSGP